MTVLPGDWSGLVVFCAGTSWDGNRLPDQHIAERLARWAPVLYVDPPMSLLTPRLNPELAASLQGPRLRLLAPGLARLTPVVLPAMGRVVMRDVTGVLTRRALRRAVRDLGGDVRAVVAASLAAVFGAFPSALEVLYATDDFVAGAELMGIPTGWLRRREARQLAQADRVVVISSVLAAKWAARGIDTVCIPNGCDAELFRSTDQAPLPADVDLPAPVAGFIGHLSDRIDMGLLEAVAGRGRSLLLVGPKPVGFEVRRVERLLAMPNVVWLGARPFASLPSYLRVMKVGLLPYVDSEFNRASFPLKTLEYLAGGRAVVATDLPAVRSLGTDLIEVASGPEEFADAVDRALGAPDDPALVARRQRLAAEHSWARRAAQFAEVLGLDVEPPARS